MTTLDRITGLAEAHSLSVAGGVQKADAPLPDGIETLILLSPDGPAFWDHFQHSPEYCDGLPDPMDRWSVRVIDQLAQDLSAQPLYPFGTTPPHPFYRWALVSGRVWASPVQWLLHDTAGLWLSFRGALGFATRLDLPEAGKSPCEGCARPCVTACPVGALTDKGYDVPACHAFLDTPDGARCLSHGCAVRAACPVSQTYGRTPAQSEFHMRHFHR